MKFNIIFIVLLLILVPVHAENASDNETIIDDDVDAGTTPDNAWYFLDTFMDDLRLALTSGEESKIKLELEIAEERLAEVKAMALKEDIQGMIKAEKNHEKIFIKLQEELESQNGNGTEVDEEVRNRFEHHNTEVTRVRGDLDIMIKTKGTLTAEQEAAIEALIASFEGKEGKIKIEIDNDSGKSRIKVKTENQEREHYCKDLNETSCIVDENCEPEYEEESCEDDEINCTAELVFDECDDLDSEDDEDESEDDEDDDDGKKDDNSGKNPKIEDEDSEEDS